MSDTAEPGSDELRADGHVGSILEAARAHASRSGAAAVQPRHLLRAALENGKVREALERLGVPLDKLEAEIADELSSHLTPSARDVTRFAPGCEQIVRSAIDHASHISREVRRRGRDEIQSSVANLGMLAALMQRRTVTALNRYVPHAPAGFDDLMAELASQQRSHQTVQPLTLLIDPGTASAADIGELLAEISTLYRMMGGSGITFRPAEAREAVPA